MLPRRYSWCCSSVSFLLYPGQVVAMSMAISKGFRQALVDMRARIFEYHEPRYAKYKDILKPVRLSSISRGDWRNMGVKVQHWLSGYALCRCGRGRQFALSPLTACYWFTTLTTRSYGT